MTSSLETRPAAGASNGSVPVGNKRRSAHQDLESMGSAAQGDCHCQGEQFGSLGGGKQVSTSCQEVWGRKFLRSESDSRRDERTVRHSGSLASGLAAIDHQSERSWKGISCRCSRA